MSTPAKEEEADEEPVEHGPYPAKESRVSRAKQKIKETGSAWKQKAGEAWRKRQQQRREEKQMMRKSEAEGRRAGMQRGAYEKGYEKGRQQARGRAMAWGQFLGIPGSEPRRTYPKRTQTAHPQRRAARARPVQTFGIAQFAGFGEKERGCNALEFSGVFQSHRKRKGRWKNAGEVGSSLLERGVFNGSAVSVAGEHSTAAISDMWRLQTESLRRVAGRDVEMWFLKWLKRRRQMRKMEWAYERLTLLMTREQAKLLLSRQRLNEQIRKRKSNPDYVV
jgi:hypothetical protein